MRSRAGCRAIAACSARTPGRALSPLFRGKFRAGLRKAGLLDQVPAAVWRKDWVVHLQHAGRGAQVLDYLARYVFRVALVNSRLERFEDGRVTFRYRDGRTGTTKRCNYSNPQFDKLIDEEQRTPDNKKRIAILQQAGKILMEDAPFVPLYNLAAVYGSAKNLSWKMRPDEKVLGWDMKIV